MVGLKKTLVALLFSGASAGAFAECEEVGYIATFDVKSGSEGAFEQAITTVAAKVLEVEPGTLFYAPYRGQESRYYMMERYTNEAARQAHAKSPEVLALFPAVMATLAEPITVEAVSAVCAL
ncbi:MAG: putative quinol monooxygenase [Pseudomonadales bacterium]